MDSRYCTIINGKEIPNWAVKPLEELSEWELRKRALWCEVCRMALEMYQNPEQWVERIRNPDHKKPWKHTEGVYFNKYISDDFIALKCKIKGFKLDEKAEAPLNDFTNRQIIDALYHNAYDRLYYYTVSKLKKVCLNEPLD